MFYSHHNEKIRILPPLKHKMIKKWAKNYEKRKFHQNNIIK